MDFMGGPLSVWDMWHLGQGADEEEEFKETILRILF